MGLQGLVLVAGCAAVIVVIALSIRGRRPADPRDAGLVPMSRTRALLLNLYGPADADGWDNPLHGTRYDPVIRQHREQERRERARAARVRHR